MKSPISADAAPATLVMPTSILSNIVVEHKPKEASPERIALLQFISASTAACGAVTVTHPFDLLKTRRQLQNELIKVQKIDVSAVEKISIRSVYKWEGAGGVYRGLMPAYIYQVLMNGVRFAVYEPLRLALGKEVKSATGGAEWVQVPCNVVSGATAGALGAAMGSPFNLIKTRLQSYSPHFATGHQHKYTGMVDAISSIGRSGEGISGFYHGVPAAIARTAVGSAVQLATYDFCKSLAIPLGLRQDQIGVHFVAALTSGILVCTAMNPFDVIMTRLFNQSAVKSEKLYTGLIDCATKTVKIEGWRALFKGYIPHYIRIGPHTLLTLMFLEQVRTAIKPFILD